ncbi:MAG: hypothetical protein HWE15_05220 [Algoriphagus sp.]|uniref:DUF6503 family protein n=1 Tax=Algoriphagus sp. TaxID=1872435 RepID=UPI0017DF00A9|nr:DUF6503 family protein [Algoriphagus sp.]NVJ85684.1 hypothetical protein [Algoriphagus sp.]
MKINYLVVFSLSILIACTPRTEAEKIVDEAIEAHGGKRYESARVDFDFRDYRYQIFKSPSRFEYSREFADSTGQVRDLLNNDGFKRTVNGVVIDTLTEERIGSFSRSVNSVAYFALLPYGLNDAAVIKDLLGETTLKGEPYDLIKVTFQQEGGGDDFDDEFLYWIHKETHFVDYMAYSYHTDGGGVRFREVSSAQTVEGIRFQNYLNYKPENKDTPVEKLKSLYEQGKLELLSEINLENIQVEMVK